MIAAPGPGDVPAAAVARRVPRAWPGCSATSCCPTARRPTPTPAGCSSATWPRPPRSGFTFYTHPEIEFFLLRRAARGRRSSRCRSTPAATTTTPRTASPTTSAGPAITMLESMGISVEYSHHEGAPGPAGDRPALRRRADHRRQHHVVPAGDEGSGDRAGRLRHVHAQAVHRPSRLGHAHPRVAVRGRPERVLRGRRRVPAVQDGPGVHRRAAPARAGDHRRVQPVGELLQAAVGRRPSAPPAPAERPRPTSAGATTTAPP